MLILRGAPALSDFRNQRLLTRLQDVLPNIEAVYALSLIHISEPTRR